MEITWLYNTVLLTTRTTALPIIQRLRERSRGRRRCSVFYVESTEARRWTSLGNHEFDIQTVHRDIFL